MSDEKKIISLISARLGRGRGQYGPWLIDNDCRDYLQEALEEALDLAIYLAGEILRLQKKKEVRNE